MNRILGAFLATAIAASASAEDVKYVSDDLHITVRTGKGTDFQVLRTIDSGTRVELLEAGNDGYARIRLENGVVGWVLSRYLVDTPIARHRLAEATEEIARITEENARLKEQTTALQQHKLDTDEELSRLKEQRRGIAEKLSRYKSLAAKPMEIEAKNQALQARIQDLESETRLLHEKSVSLQRGAERAWFLTGGGVLLGGILLGLIIPRLRWKRKSGWDRF